MVSFKVKLNSNQCRVIEDRKAITSNFKIYSDKNEKINILERESSGKIATKLLLPTRNSLPVTKGALMDESSDVKKGFAENLNTSKKKNDSAVKVKVQRKVLADVSNVRSYIFRNRKSDGVKPLVSEARGTACTSMSSRKATMGTRRTSLGQGANPHTATKVDMKGSKVYADSQKTKGLDHESISNNARKTAKPALISTRKSLPVTKGATIVDPKENGKNTKRSASNSVKVMVGRKVVPCVSNERTYLRRNRASDGFISMIQVDRGTFYATTLSKRPLGPTGKFTHSVSSMRFGSNTALGLKKPKAAVAAATSKRKGEIPTVCEPKNTKFVGSHGNNSITNPADVISGAKTSRRKSFTSSLVARPEILRVSTDVIKHVELPPIDDNRNHLEVAEYVNDIYQYYWVMEAESTSLANYMEIQTDDITPKMRGILINWLIEVHYKFDLMPETLFLMVVLFDRFLSVFPIKKNDMQLVGLTALLLASKYEDFWHPKEKLILKKLLFRLNTPTPYVFMLRFLKASQSDAKVEKLAFYLIELCLVEYESLKFKPSLLCASAIYIARCTLHETPAWTPLLCKHSHYEEPQLRVCANMILRFQKGASRGPLRVAYDKYMQDDHCCVAGIKALDRLPSYIEPNSR
ncbi:hypothetical protein C5167_008726 [Papaver somniferum]|uniref:Cyclin N-terminal domain-containing protein n=1 Tax=Papaver somniferum TaxID=3469 RepID=A0A4Y7JVE4_PAPSO|nr:hypothetical protein C5167_008726 [Papaver somniferum]